MRNQNRYLINYVRCTKYDVLPRLVYTGRNSKPYLRHKSHIRQDLGTASAQVLTALAEDNRTIFSVADAQEILGKSYNTTLHILRWLTRAGWLVRLTAGRYAIVPLFSGNEATPHLNRYVVAREILEETPY